ncbi:MAG: hypothetical protein ACTTKL_00995 [Treponema sp.]
MGAADGTTAVQNVRAVAVSPAMFLRGSMNNWDATAMTLDMSSGEAVWSCRVNLFVGTVNFVFANENVEEEQYCIPANINNAAVVPNGITKNAKYIDGRQKQFSFTVTISPLQNGEYAFIFNETRMTVQVKRKR